MTHLFFQIIIIAYVIRTDEVLALIILPLLVPFAHMQVKRKRNGSATDGKNYFQPSKIEQKQGFLLHVKVITFSLLIVHKDIHYFMLCFVGCIQPRARNN